MTKTTQRIKQGDVAIAIKGGSKAKKPSDAERGFADDDLREVSDNPPQTNEQLAQAKPFAEVFPDLAAKLRRGRGKQKTPTKQQVTLRLDADVLDAFRAKGEGWQVRINEALRRAAKLGKKKSAA